MTQRREDIQAGARTSTQPPWWTRDRICAQRRRISRARSNAPKHAMRCDSATSPQAEIASSFASAPRSPRPKRAVASWPCGQFPWIATGSGRMRGVRHLVSFATAPRLCRLRVSLRICLYIYPSSPRYPRRTVGGPSSSTHTWAVSLSSPVRSIDAPVL